MSNDTFEVTCPCCHTKLTLDSDNGRILFEDRPKKAAPEWEAVVQAGADKKEAAERMFAQNMDRERNADDLLNRKFEEALKRADKSPDPPPRIFDLD